MQTAPDILVLGGGGVLGEAWMTGLLAGLEDGAGFKLDQTAHFVGTSAGSIVAARLAAGQPLRRPETDPRLLPALPEVRFRRTMPELVATATVPVRTVATTLLAPISSAAATLGGMGGNVFNLALSVSAPFASAALGVATPAGALARIAALALLPEATGSLQRLRDHFDGQALSFDGRLIITAVDRSSGRRVLFGAPGAPQATVAEAVHASCTVPWMFAPVSIGGVEYVDGGVWSPTNLDAAPVNSVATRPCRVLCLNPTAGLRGPHPILTVARAASASAMALEATALRTRGAHVTAVGPSREASEAMGANLMSTGPRHEVLAAGYRQGLELAAS